MNLIPSCLLSKITNRLLVFGGALLLTSTLMSATWENYEAAEKEDKPRTAIKILDELIVQESKAKNYGKLAQAVVLKLNLQTRIDAGDEKILTRLDEAIEAAPAEVAPVYWLLRGEAISRHMRSRYYYSRNAASDEAKVADPENMDVTTWSDQRRYHEMVRSYAMAFQDKALLQKLKVSDFSGVLEPGAWEGGQRPTLYDFVAHECLKILGKHASVKDGFNVTSDSPAFASLDEFLAWEVLAGDWSPEMGFTMDASWQDGVKLWQELLRFHKDDEDKTALLHADLYRLEWMDRASKSESYLNNRALRDSLSRVMEENRENPLMARASLILAELLRDEDPAKARELALGAAEKFPDHPFGKMCADLVAKIERPKVEFKSNSAWIPGERIMEVKSRNVKELFGRVYRVDWDEVDEMDFTKSHLHGERAEKFVAWLNKNRPASSFRLVVDDEVGDYREVGTPVEYLKNLKFGMNVMVFSMKDDFSLKDNEIYAVPGFATPFVFTHREPADGGDGSEGYVINGTTGAPVNDVKLSLLDEKLKRLGTTKTDRLGYFRVKSYHNRFNLLAEGKGGAMLRMETYNYRGRSEADEDDEVIVFFTDRAAYRPGQKVQFKGIVLAARKGNDPAVLEKGGKEFEITFNGANREVIASQKVTTNGFGSFAGEFDIPNVGLLGRYSLSCVSASGSASFRVEEYKRPVFEATAESVDKNIALGDTVKIKITATAYSSEPIDGAKVSWYGGLASDPKQSGEATTGKDGTCIVEFLAEDEAGSQGQGNHFTLSGKVVSPSGESIDVSWSAYLASASYGASLLVESPLLNVEEPAIIEVWTISNDDAAVSREGMVSVYRVIQPSVEELLHNPIVSPVPSKFEPEAPRDPERKLGEKISEHEVITDEENGVRKLTLDLPSGELALVYSGKDERGREVTTRKDVVVYDLMSNRGPAMISQLVDTSKPAYAPGEVCELVWASGFGRAQACVEFFRDNKLLKRVWTNEERTQQIIPFEVTEELKGGFTVIVTQVTHGRLYQTRRNISVPWTDRNLKLDWKRITSKLKPGEEDTWSVSVTPPDGMESAPVEMVATLYDASLDALFGAHRFASLANHYGSDSSWINGFRLASQWEEITSPVIPSPWPDYHWEGGDELDWTFANVVMRDRHGRFGVQSMSVGESSADPFSTSSVTAGNRSGDFGVTRGALDSILNSSSEEEPPPLEIRRNLNETAFFMPQLVSDDDGVVTMSFTMPEAVTEWRFLGYAHDKQMRGGSIMGETITAKDFMVRPNPPRFVRVGDEIQFTARLVNQSDKALTVTPAILLKLATSDKEVTADFVTSRPEIQQIPAGESRTVSWTVRVGETTEWLIYQTNATAQAAEGGDTFTDGEERWLPVLPRRVLVRDAMTRTLRDEGTTTMEFDPVKAIDRNDPEAPVSLSYTVEAVARPAWMAVKALPYLMEYPHACSEQLFNRYYANSIAALLVANNPGIEKIFTTWKKDAETATGQDAFTSSLELNPELKGVMINETPWVQEAKDERAERLKIAMYFDTARVRAEMDGALRKLSEAQMGNGAWPWFAGSHATENFYITSYITAGFGRLRKMGADSVNIGPALRATAYLDSQMTRRYNLIEKEDLEKNHMSHDVAVYFYARSFFMKDVTVESKDRVAFEFWLAQMNEHWTDVKPLRSRAQMALTLHRLDKKEAARMIMESLRENAVEHDDLGMHWNALSRGGSWWWEAPIEAQAVIIEALGEVSADEKAVSDCQLWLLQQKRTQHWASTTATADAIYALLNGGDVKLLSNDTALSIVVGGRDAVSSVSPTAETTVEAGTGRVIANFSGESVTAADATIVIEKTGKGQSWVNIYWQSLQDIATVGDRDTSNGDDRDAAMAMKKAIYVKRTVDNASKLMPLADAGGLKVGDTLVVRLTIRNDRAYEFVHIKDQRPSGAEPMDAISGYKWNGDTWFYQETRDAATHFFIDALPAGSHVLEYEMRLQHAGKYDSGVGEIECLYAPEFRARSASTKLEVAPLK